MNFKEKLEKIISDIFDYPGDTNPVDKILALIEADLIGEDQEFVEMEPKNTFTQRAAKGKYQNDLKQEQREKLKKH